MLITTNPPVPQARATMPPPPPDPEPKPEPAPPKFREAARSFRRDALLGGALLASAAGVMPRYAGPVVGAFGILAGYGELREGMRKMDTHETIDGVLHMAASSTLIAASLVNNLFFATMVAGGGLAVLGLKALYDHPRDALDVLVGQPLALIRDAAGAIVEEFKDHPELEGRQPADQTWESGRKP
ncbi:MAG: hypothetical protein AB1758_30695, partial [Candidatus Eremiobacterota bacterium]